MVDNDNSNSRRASGRLSKTGEVEPQGRLSGRQIKPVQKLTPTQHAVLDYDDLVPVQKPQQASQPLLDDDVIALIEADPPKAVAEPCPPVPPQSQVPRTPKNQAEVPIDDDTRYLIKKDADAVRDSRKLLKAVKRNEGSIFNGGQTGWKRDPKVGLPSDRPPSAEEYERDASGSRRIYLAEMRDFGMPKPPVLRLTRQVEEALAGRGRLEMDVLPLRGGTTTVHLSVDVFKEHRCGLTVQHSSGKHVDQLTLVYRAPCTSTQPGDAGIERVFSPRQVDEHNVHKDHITRYAIPDAEANWAYLRKWVQRAADGSLFGRKGLLLVRFFEQIATRITHRTSLDQYLQGASELARAEIDARKATRLVLDQGLTWNEEQGAPQGLINAQARLRDEYDILIARWNAVYVCCQQLARQYGRPLATPQGSSAPSSLAGCVAVK